MYVFFPWWFSSLEYDGVLLPFYSSLSEGKKKSLASFWSCPPDRIFFFFHQHRELWPLYFCLYTWTPLSMIFGQNPIDALPMGSEQRFLEFLQGHTFPWAVILRHHTNKSACTLSLGVKVWVAYIKKEHIDNSGSQLQNAILERFF